MNRLLLTLCLVQTSIFAAMAQTELLPQRHFPATVPAGNYSGIAPLGGGRYAVVSDKSETDGFFVFHIDVDSVSGQIRDVRNEGFRPATLPSVTSASTSRPATLPNRDEEGIAFRPADSTIYISGEADNAILQYRLDGSPTGRRLALPANLLAVCHGNLSLESLTYNSATHRFWTCNEGGDIVIATFGDDLQPRATYRYAMDAPLRDAARAQYYAHGVSELLALDDGTLLVLEREFYVPQGKIGASVDCRLYQVNPSAASADNVLTKTSDSAIAKNTDGTLAKTLVCQWETRLSLLGRSLANYEGMCLGPRLTDGRQTVILVADSQNQYAGVLRDWWRVVIINGKIKT